MSEKSKRRVWQSSEKLRIVLAGMEPGVQVSEIFRWEGIQPTVPPVEELVAVERRGGVRR